jgi:hypothetical protein
MEPEYHLKINHEVRANTALQSDRFARKIVAFERYLMLRARGG